jgi:hypothetical protein
MTELIKPYNIPKNSMQKWTESWQPTEFVSSFPVEVIWDQISEKDRLIIAIQKLWSIRAYLYTVQTTATDLDRIIDYVEAGNIVRDCIDDLEYDLFDVRTLKQKYRDFMTRNQRG